MAESESANSYPEQRRRTTRLPQAVPLTVIIIDGLGRTVEEQTATVSINCHGCRYFSRYPAKEDTWVTLEFAPEKKRDEPHRLRARVVWARKSLKLKGLFQVGVEFEMPANVWGIASPPSDWQQYAVSGSTEVAALEHEMQRLLDLATQGTYYQLLGVTALSTPEQIKRNFYELARKFHPDRHMARGDWLQPLQRLMDALTLAYKTLSDEELREQYDRRLDKAGVFKLRPRRTETQKSVEECLEKARECLAAKNFVGSIPWLRKAVELDPDSPKSRVMLARSLAVIPQYRREAVEQFEKAIELDPFNPHARFQLAQLLEDLQIIAQARSHYRQVLEIDPDHAGARQRLSRLDSGEGETEKSSLIERFFSRLTK